MINWRGASSVGASAVLAFIVVTAAFLLFSALAVPHATNLPWVPFTPGSEKPITQSLGLGMSAVMWSYMGWDNVSTFAGDVKDPGRTFPRALLISVALVTILYLIPMAMALASSSDWQQWDSDTYTISQVASKVVGPWLGGVIAFSVMFSNWSLFNSQLLYTSRLPFAMAADGLLPKILTRTHAKYGTPTVSLILCGVIYAAFTVLNFKKLVVIDVLIYAISLILEHIALIRLRWLRPEINRPFSIPGGTGMLILFLLSMLGFAGASVVFMLMSDNEWIQLLIVAAMIGTGPLAYAALNWRRARKRIVDGEPAWLDEF